jgi:hypothetical protein
VNQPPQVSKDGTARSYDSIVIHLPNVSAVTSALSPNGSKMRVRSGTRPFSRVGITCA